MKNEHLWLVGLLVLVVLIVFFAPSIKLEPTALRAAQAAAALQMALVSAALTLSLLLRFALFCVLREHFDSPVATEDLVDLNCTRLC